MIHGDGDAASSALEKRFSITLTDKEREEIDFLDMTAWQYMSYSPADAQSLKACNRVRDAAAELSSALREAKTISEEGHIRFANGKDGRLFPRGNPTRTLISYFAPNPFENDPDDGLDLSAIEAAIAKITQACEFAHKDRNSLQPGAATKKHGYDHFIKDCRKIFNSIGRRHKWKSDFYEKSDGTFAGDFLDLVQILEIATPAEWRINDPAKIGYQIKKALKTGKLQRTKTSVSP